MQFSKSKVTNQGLDMQDRGQDSGREDGAWGIHTARKLLEASIFLTTAYEIAVLHGSLMPTRGRMKLPHLSPSSSPSLKPGFMQGRQMNSDPCDQKKELFCACCLPPWKTGDWTAPHPWLRPLTMSRWMLGPAAETRTGWAHPRSTLFSAAVPCSRLESHGLCQYNRATTT